MLSAATLLLTGILTTPLDFLKTVNECLSTAQESRLTALFQRQQEAQELIRIARNRGGLSRFRAKVFPAPPGWTPSGHWITLHTFQDIQDDRDLVLPLVATRSGWLMGPEVREEATGFVRIRHANVAARIFPTEHRIDVTTTLSLEPAQERKAPLFRMNSLYDLKSAHLGANTAKVVSAGEDTIPVPSEGNILRAGGLWIPWTTSPLSEVRFQYTGTVNTPREDKIAPEATYVTAWWVPSLARLPHTQEVTVTGPADWEIRSEGVRTSHKVEGDLQTVSYRCDLPISYPKIVAGPYRLAATLERGGKLYRSYQLEPIEKERAERDVKIAADAVEWFSERLGPFPFQGYDIFDSDSFYGIESYSYTLLHRSITSRFTSHEVLHTYFGGLVPCAYVVDSWNEGATQYLDSVVYQENRDRTLESALRTLDITTPLARMSNAHDHGGASYWRGAYIFRMLESEFGLDSVLAAFREMIRTRRGQDTRWADLRPYFERATGADLKRFWEQWIEGGEFPTLKIAGVDSQERNGRWQTRVTVVQTSRAWRPFHMRFKIGLNDGSWTESLVTMRAPSETYTIETRLKPYDQRLTVLGFTLARVESQR